MFTVEQEIEIHRTPPDVFAFLSDPENDARWRSDVRGARLVTDGPVGQGSRIQYEIAFLGRQHPVYEVIGYEPGEAMTFLALSGPLQGSRLSYRLRPAGAGTAFRLRLDVRLRFPLRLFEPALRRPFRTQLSRFLASLQAVLERTGVTAV
jgi:uncharacterized protein YndB with AHSA1/START domain